MTGLAPWLRQVSALTAKELRQLWRDRPLLVYVVYLFTLELVLVAGGTRELSHAALLVRDGDRSAASRELVLRLREPWFTIRGEVDDPGEALRAIDHGEARLFLDIPPGFSRDLAKGERPVEVQLVVDASRVVSAYLAPGYAARIAGTLSRDRAAEALGRLGVDPRDLPVIENRRRTWYNPNLDDAWGNALSDLLDMMTVACVLLPAAAAVREKEHGTIEQLLVSPITPVQVMLSKALSMTMVALSGTAVALFGVLRAAYAMPARGSVPLFFAITALFAFANACMGLLLSTLARTMTQVGLLIVLTLVPVLQLSGTWSPLEAEPRLLRDLVSLSPLRHYVTVAYGILLRGAGMDVLWPRVAAIAALGAVCFAAALWRFRRQFA
ncbi:ABC transporter permease [Anaeromyxobacter oryzae]|uniref:ABC transporter permease n=1 Tax=Anaeromyxobacter oryzae TaxID=2918170 RepID=A0ABM7WQC4_9BACT|nr:ABC transporter permease [Anaeromyxobacter oryzae]BDG01666.1 ABC transporter permease [Anaeromyxobacter oryzae]